MSTALVASTQESIDNIIRLQLRKPKSWRWELTTSKSSPHICIPNVQLYNSKGILLVETKENGDTRRSWHSTAENNYFDLQRSSSGYLRRQRHSGSEIQRSSTQKNEVAKSVSQKKEFRSKEAQRRQVERSEIQRNKTQNNEYHSRDRLRNSAERITSYDEVKLFKESLKSKNIYKDINKRNVLEKLKRTIRDSSEGRYIPKETYSLKKSNSDIIGNKILATEFMKKKISQKSDDLFQRKLKYSDIDDKASSLVKNSNMKSKEDGIDVKNKKKFKKCLIDFVQIENDAGQKLNISQMKHKKYKTRTCSAGTLVIEEESFSYPNRRRRRTLDGMEEKTIVNNAKSSVNRREQLSKLLNSTLNGNKIPKTDLIRKILDENEAKKNERELYHSKSDMCVFKNTRRDSQVKTKLNKQNYKFDENKKIKKSYSAIERDGLQKTGFQDVNKEKKLKKKLRRSRNRSTSSSSSDKEDMKIFLSRRSNRSKLKILQFIVF